MSSCGPKEKPIFSKSPITSACEKFTNEKLSSNESVPSTTVLKEVFPLEEAPCSVYFCRKNELILGS
jgi:hypothetical protein